MLPMLPMLRTLRRPLLCATLLLAVAPLAAQAPPAILTVDATEAPQRIFHAHLTLPAAPGPLTLYYPKWIPGEHGPTGPVVNLTGLRFSAGGKPIAWRRDAVDMLTFHLEVPAGATAVEADLDYLSPVEGGWATTGPATSAALAVLSWNTVLLYPAGKSGDDLTYQASLRLPAGWRQASARPVTSDGGGEVAFGPVSMTTLIDSPALLGAHLAAVPLRSSDGVAHRIDIGADEPAALTLPPGFDAGYSRLVEETGALFGARHYRSYRWLLALSDHVAHFGLEHHESSDNRMPAKTLLTEGLRNDLAGLLAHEFVHSWNGKHRRPAGLVDPDYHQPIQSELLWVYEGLTQYLATILPARSALWTPEHFRERLAVLAANLDHIAGRAWRPLGDTAVAAQSLFGSAQEGRSWRRGADFYDESVLIWLEADAIIRRESKGQRSMDDFCRRFHGGVGGAPRVLSYTSDDVLATLAALAPYDWKKFLDERLWSTGPRAPLSGLETQGWRLVYDERPNPALQAREERSEGRDWTYSLGFQLDNEGRVRDVVPGLPAAQAGIGPGMTVVAVDGRKYTAERLDAALDRTRAKSEAPLELLIENAESYRTVQVDYRGGRRYPHLERIADRPDGLSQVIAARAKGR
jgi:predicted metalloprotease with PDZ domain